MFAPTARTTPTRLPWWWPLLAAWLLMALWSPAFAGEIEPQLLREPAQADDGDPMRVGDWQLLTLPLALGGDIIGRQVVATTRPCFPQDP